MILVDANVFMYAAGADHPFRRPSQAFVERIAAGDEDVAIDAEVLQEILHRYRAIERWEAGKAVYDNVRRLIPAVIPITVEALDGARVLLDRYPWLSARDALHASVALLHGAEAICSYDRDLDGIEGLKRVEPWIE